MVRVFFHYDGETLLETARSVERGLMTASDSNIPALACLNGSGDLAGDDSIQPSHIRRGDSVQEAGGGIGIVFSLRDSVQDFTSFVVHPVARHPDLRSAL